MKLINSILFFAFLFSINSYSLENLKPQFDGKDWRGSYCSSYGDGLFQGRYNYKFSESGKVESYIEYYTDFSCKTKNGYIDPQIKGTYKIKSVSNVNDTYFYDLEVKLTHLNYPVFFKIKVAKNNMTLCWNNIGCSEYTKISN